VQELVGGEQVGHGNLWPVYGVWQAARGQVTGEPQNPEQSYEQRRQLAVAVVDRLHGDPSARREVLEAARRSSQHMRSD
jgi:hypothetical protein